MPSEINLQGVLINHQILLFNNNVRTFFQIVGLSNGKTNNGKHFSGVCKTVIERIEHAWH